MGDPLGVRPSPARPAGLSWLSSRSPQWRQEDGFGFVGRFAVDEPAPPPARRVIGVAEECQLQASPKLWPSPKSHVF